MHNKSHNKTPKTVSIKIGVFGPSNAGKTSIINRYCDNTYNKYCSSTQSPSMSETVRTIHNYEYEVQIFENPGKEDHLTKHLGDDYFKLFDCIIFVYDVTDNKSFDLMTEWFQKINHKIEQLEHEHKHGIYKLVIGNKIEEHLKRKVPKDKAIAFVDSIHYDYIEVSAAQEGSVEKQLDNIILNMRKTNNKKGKCCIF